MSQQRETTKPRPTVMLVVQDDGDGLTEEAKEKAKSTATREGLAHVPSGANVKLMRELKENLLGLEAANKRTWELIKQARETMPTSRLMGIVECYADAYAKNNRTFHTLTAAMRMAADDCIANAPYLQNLGTEEARVKFHATVVTAQRALDRNLPEEVRQSIFKSIKAKYDTPEQAEKERQEAIKKACSEVD